LGGLFLEGYHDAKRFRIVNNRKGTVNVIEIEVMSIQS
jgi:hypothetical protein